MILDETVLPASTELVDDLTKNVQVLTSARLGVREAIDSCLRKMRYRHKAPVSWAIIAQYKHELIRAICLAIVPRFENSNRLPKSKLAALQRDVPFQKLLADQQILALLGCRVAIRDAMQTDDRDLRFPLRAQQIWDRKRSAIVTFENYQLLIAIIGSGQVLLPQPLCPPDLRSALTNVAALSCFDSTCLPTDRSVAKKYQEIEHNWDTHMHDAITAMVSYLLRHHYLDATPLFTELTASWSHTNNQALEQILKTKKTSQMAVPGIVVAANCARGKVAVG